MLAFARRQPLQARAIDIASLVMDMGDLIRTSVGPQIKLTFDLGTDLPLAKVDPQQVEMALLNLCVNARDAMPDGGALAISTRGETVDRDHPLKLKPGRYIRLCIADTGVGMDETTMAQATEPFFSTKGIGKGTGLGLSMVHGLVSQLGGALGLSSKSGAGTTVELFLPVSAELNESAKPAAVAVAPAAQAIGRVLLVDDEYLVRASTAEMLGELGYEVVEAASAEEALSVLEREPHIDGIITDHLMPGMSGVDLAHAIRVKRPGTPILILSGYATEGLEGDLPMLSKPFRQTNLAATVAALLQQAAK
jgi:CheY-like chemotaxis protein